MNKPKPEKENKNEKRVKRQKPEITDAELREIMREEHMRGLHDAQRFAEKRGCYEQDTW